MTTIEYHDGAVTYLSDEGYRRLNAERRKTAVFMGSAVGLVVVLCATFIIKILGAV
ncbi:MAG TPA: hypothetical protein VF783_13885 [Terriglobales bacterium]